MRIHDILESRLLMRISKRGKALSLSILAPLLFVIAFGLVIVVYNNFHQPPEVDVMTTGFAPQKIGIIEGETLRFVNRSPTVTQFLCIGTDKRCDNYAFLSLQLPPLDLRSPGLRIAPGQAKDVVFDADGTFHITSPVTASTNLTVTVSAAS